MAGNFSFQMNHPSSPLYSFYSEIYGQRWSSLYEALCAPEKQVIRINTLSEDFERGILFEKFLRLVPFSELENCYERDLSKTICPERTSDGLLDNYIMSPASVFVARNLEVQPDDRILDLCAAPGGKTLVLLEKGLSQFGELIANERSEIRREKLIQVIRQYVSLKVRDRVWVKGKDGVQFGLVEANRYDRILVDAPCSGERHLIERPQLLDRWSIKSSKNLSMRQYSLLSSAWSALKPGGVLIYSTCTMSSFENDGVVGKLLKKKKEKIQLLEPRFKAQLMEKTEFGYQFLPDQCGYGPIYFSIFKKTGELEE